MSPLLLLLSGCSLIVDGKLYTGGDAGGDATAADAPPDAGDATPDADPCGPLMVRVGSYCVDQAPLLLPDGSQGAPVTYEDAVLVCAARGARLCTEAEREAACDVVEQPRYCSAADSWEWSADGCTAPERRRSPCCTVDQGFGECTAVVPTASYHCCRSVETR
jgi:hypothetical protein